MNDQDKARFKVLIEQMFDVYDKEVSNSTLKIFWESLKGFEIKNVSSCVEKYVHSNSHFPKPFDIVNLCRSNLAYEQKQLTHEYQPVSKEKAAENIQKIKDMLRGLKKPHPKQWCISILSDPNYTYAVGLSIAKKVYNELTPRELRQLDPEGKWKTR